MDLRLAGRRALVTGSSGGIGAVIAETLAAEGCGVLIHGRSADSAAGVADRVRSLGAPAEVVLGDLTEPGVAERVAVAAVAFGARILVNNAGPLAEHDWDSAEPEDWLAAFNGNVVSTARVTRGLLPALRNSGWGRVVNMGSRAVTTPLPHLVEYSAAKAAVVNLTTSLAKQLAGTGVTANCVSPGVIVTPTMKQLFTDRAEKQGRDADWATLEPLVAAEYAPNPTGRLGRAGDIADTVAFLSSPVADYINGINLRVDGGITLTP
ncbi:MAG: SDR family NAD(P)-dependent oxidoreductase [Stackebrandtia sp.]